MRLESAGTPFDAAMRLPMSLVMAHFASPEWERQEKLRDAINRLKANQVAATNNVVRAVGQLGNALVR